MFKQGLGALDATWLRSNRRHWQEGHRFPVSQCEDDGGGGGDDDDVSVATSTVSLKSTNHLLARMEERRIVRRDLQHTKKHGNKSVDPKTGRSLFRHNGLVYITVVRDRIGITAYREHSVDNKTRSVGRQHAPKHVALGRAHRFRSRTRGKTCTLIRAHGRGRAGRRGIKHLLKHATSCKKGGKRTLKVMPGPRARWVRQLVFGLSTYPETYSKMHSCRYDETTVVLRKKKKKKKSGKPKKKKKSQPEREGAEEAAGPGIRGRRARGVLQKPKQQKKQTKSGLPPPPPLPTVSGRSAPPPLYHHYITTITTASPLHHSDIFCT